MKLHLSYASLALIFLVGCGDDTRTDAGMPGTDSGMMMMQDAGTPPTTDSGPTDAGLPPVLDAGPPDTNASMRNEAANDAIRMTDCGCDMGVFATAEQCAAFNDSDVAATCADMAYDTHFATVGAFFTCQAQINEDFQTCFAAAACDDDAIEACEAAAGAFSCPTVSEADAMAYQTTLETCLETMVVGPAGACPDDSGAINTTGASVFMGTTVGAGTDLDAPTDCYEIEGGGGSPERALRWTAPAAGEYTFDTIGSDFDTVLYLLNTCEDATAVACNDDIGAEDFRSSLTATLTEGQEVLVVVEGFASTNAGNFVVNITPPE
ncbi:MAG: hypothetical protein AB8I08_08780 [Sandaracinaceae bacterium]